MSEETLVVAEPSTASTPVGQPIQVQIPDRWKDMDVSRGPLVDITPEERAEFRTTGNLPKTEEAATSSVAKPEGGAKTAGESETPKTQEKPKEQPKPKQTAEERIAQLEATIEVIRKRAEIKKTPTAESSPAKPEVVSATRTKPTPEDKKEDGNPKYATYEDYVEELADWKADQRWATQQRAQQQQSQANELNAKVAEARTRYENFDEVMTPTVAAIVGDADVSPAVKAMLNDSDVLPDLIFTIGSNKEELASFVKMAKESPGKALRYIALTESLIAEELAGKKETSEKPAEEAPVKPKTQAPRPPSEAGGRAAAPPDALEAATKAGDFRSFKNEANRRAIAKLKG